MLAAIDENRMSETVGMQDLLRKNFPVVMEVIDPEPPQIAGKEDVDIPIARIAMKFALNVFTQPTMAVAKCDIVRT